MKKTTDDQEIYTKCEFVLKKQSKIIFHQCKHTAINSRRNYGWKEIISGGNLDNQEGMKHNEYHDKFVKLKRNK